MTSRIYVDKYEAWLALRRFFSYGACLFNTSNNVLLNFLQELIFLFEKANHKN